MCLPGFSPCGGMVPVDLLSVSARRLSPLLHLRPHSPPVSPPTGNLVKVGIAQLPQTYSSRAGHPYKLEHCLIPHGKAGMVPF